MRLMKSASASSKSHVSKAATTAISSRATTHSKSCLSRNHSRAQSRARRPLAYTSARNSGATRERNPTGKSGSNAP
eukprot:11220986-Lingulodinium_polyedra.AAC.1